VRAWTAFLATREWRRIKPFCRIIRARPDYVLLT
jgi:hypothetical protein